MNRGRGRGSGPFLSSSASQHEESWFQSLRTVGLHKCCTMVTSLSPLFHAEGGGKRGAGDLAEVAVTLVCVVGHEVGPL